MLPRAAWHRFAPAPCAWLRAVVGTPWIYRCPEEASRLRSEALPKGSTAYGGGVGAECVQCQGYPARPQVLQSPTAAWAFWGSAPALASSRLLPSLGCGSRGVCGLTDGSFTDLHITKNRLQMQKYHIDKSE